MIGKLTGLLCDKNPPEITVDCHGVGYEVFVPMSTFYNLPATGEQVSLLTHFVVREDAQILYGFGSAAEREAESANLVAGNIQHIFAVTEQTGDGTRSTAQQVRELARMAEELRQSVARFKIG